MTESSDSPSARVRTCRECDYNLTGVQSDRCPECGSAIEFDDNWIESPLRQAQRIGLIATASVLGAGSWIAIAALLMPSRGLSLADGVTVIGVLFAGLGHVSLAVLAARSHTHWPMHRGEARNILRFLGWLSMLSAVVGASQALSVPTGRGVEGTVIGGAFEFFLRLTFFMFPGGSLLFLCLVAFQPPPAAARGVMRREAQRENPPGPPPFTVEVARHYECRQIRQRITDEPRPTAPTVEQMIEEAWQRERATAKKESRMLFNGALVRMVAVAAGRGHLDFVFGPTCFRDFVGTNLFHAERIHTLNPAYLSDALGASAAVTTSDGFLAFGRRSDRVLFHQNTVHLFGGIVEESDRTGNDAGVRYDLVGCLLRELSEELGIARDAVTSIRVTGLVRDRRILQPELIFDVTVTATRDELAARIAADAAHGEHTELICVPDDPDAALRFLLTQDRLTPVAAAGLLLHGRYAWGDAWYEQTCYVLYGREPPQGSTAGEFVLSPDQAGSRTAK